MNAAPRAEVKTSPLTGKTARDVMTAGPVSISATATVLEVVAFLTDSGYSAAPVIDESGRPIGVVSRTDVVVYDRARAASAKDVPGYFDQADLMAPARAEAPAAGQGPLVRASDLMTQAVFSVGLETPIEEVAGQMVDLNVHRLFVVDDSNVLVGVISVLDLLRHLCGRD
jgi:CBS domain-containing protein